MSINYSDYNGEMCGKCVCMDMKERRNYISDEYWCTKDRTYYKWNGKPCSRYSPDNSDRRIQTIEDGRCGRL